MNQSASVFATNHTATVPADLGRNTNCSVPVHSFYSKINPPRHFHCGVRGNKRAIDCLTCSLISAVLMFMNLSVLVFFSQLYIKQHPFVFADMNPPAAVFPLAVPLGPVWRQNHTSGAGQVTSTLCCRQEGGQVKGQQTGKSNRIQGIISGTFKNIITCYYL